MTDTGSLVNSDEIAALAARYGQPLRWSRALDVSPATIEDRRDKRSAEVVLVMPRPQNRVLLHTKQFYPPGAYRLLSGGIEIGEPVDAAALRETYEETGLMVPLSRLLGVIEYEFRSGNDSVPFVSYVFLTGESSEAPHVTDAGERITDFREIEWSELQNVADALDQLSDQWRDWGRFRAIAHRLVAELGI